MTIIMTLYSIVQPTIDFNHQKSRHDKTYFGRLTLVELLQKGKVVLFDYKDCMLRCYILTLRVNISQ